MKRRFIIQIDGFLPEQEKSLIDAFRNKRFGWWHRFPGHWMVIDHTGTESPQSIRDMIRQVDRVALCLIMFIPPGKAFWSGTKFDDDMFSWVKLEWNAGELAKSVAEEVDWERSQPSSPVIK